eukprot:Hpha_TRINITY_DN3818_c0_g1::TRINITY_DN3818_c0_g1_i1::g.44531::m.44531
MDAAMRGMAGPLVLLLCAAPFFFGAGFVAAFAGFPPSISLECEEKVPSAEAMLFTVAPCSVRRRGPMLGSLSGFSSRTVGTILRTEVDSASGWGTGTFPFNVVLFLILGAFAAGCGGSSTALAALPDASELMP